jgi:hypothetical protein
MKNFLNEGFAAAHVGVGVIVISRAVVKDRVDLGCRRIIKKKT